MLSVFILYMIWYNEAFIANYIILGIREQTVRLVVS